MCGEAGSLAAGGSCHGHCETHAQPSPWTGSSHHAQETCPERLTESFTIIYKALQAGAHPPNRGHIGSVGGETGVDERLSLREDVRLAGEERREGCSKGDIGVSLQGRVPGRGSPSR